MNILERKQAVYEELVHGDSIKLRNLYEACLPCSIKTGQVYLSSDIILMHDLSDLDLTYKTLILSINHLPILSTSTTQELVNDYNERHHGIFSKVTTTIRLYFGLERKRYKNPLVDKELMLMPLNGSVRKNASFINPMLVDTIHKSRRYETTINFMNFLSVILETESSVMNNRMTQAMEHYFLYFYHELCDDKLHGMYWKGAYLPNHLESFREIQHGIDDERLRVCRNKVEYYSHVQKYHQTLTIQEFIGEYDSYWDII